MTNAESAYMNAKITRAIAGAFQVRNRRYNRRSSGRDNSSPRSPRSKVPADTGQQGGPDEDPDMVEHVRHQTQQGTERG